MVEIRRTQEFDGRLRSLGDARAKARIVLWIDRLAIGNPGDVKPVGSGISELRIDHGPGYRVYFVRWSDVVVILLCSGDKGSQDRDIVRAKAIARKVLASGSGDET